MPNILRIFIKKVKAAGHDYRLSKDGVSQIVNAIAKPMSIAAKNSNRLTKYKKTEYLINSDNPQKSKIYTWLSKITN